MCASRLRAKTPAYSKILSDKETNAEDKENISPSSATPVASAALKSLGFDFTKLSTKDHEGNVVFALTKLLRAL